MNNKWIFFIALTFLAASIACAVPGFPGAAAPALAPTVDSDRLETMVAGTVSAAIAETEQAQPAQESGPASVTGVSATGTPETIPLSSTLTAQANGSIVFVDEYAGYEITIPDGWLAVRINQQEYLDAVKLPQAADANIRESLLGIKTEDPNIFRLLVMDTNAEHIQDGFVTDINFIWEEQKSFDSIEDLQVIADKIPNAATVFRFEVSTVQIVTTSSGLQIGVIEARSSFTNPSSDEVDIYQKQVFFKGKTGTQSIIFTTLAGLKEITLSAFDTMLETISLIAK